MKRIVCTCLDPYKDWLQYFQACPPPTALNTVHLELVHRGSVTLYSNSCPLPHPHNYIVLSVTVNLPTVDLTNNKL